MINRGKSHENCDEYKSAFDDYKTKRFNVMGRVCQSLESMVREFPEE